MAFNVQFQCPSVDYERKYHNDVTSLQYASMRAVVWLSNLTLK